LRDGRNRRVVTTDTITFFIQQHSVNRGRAVGNVRTSGA
jgi:hypothetical protein